MPILTALPLQNQRMPSVFLMCEYTSPAIAQLRATNRRAHQASQEPESKWPGGSDGGGELELTEPSEGDLRVDSRHFSADSEYLHCNRCHCVQVNHTVKLLPAWCSAHSHSHTTRLLQKGCRLVLPVRICALGTHHVAGMHRHRLAMRT